MMGEIRRRGWHAVVTLDLDAATAMYALPAPGSEEIVATGATLDDAMGRSLLRVPPDAPPLPGARPALRSP